MASIAYCGAPPGPAEWLGRWNLDPILISALAGVGAAYAVGARRTGVGQPERRWFYAGLALAAAALVSPLCPLSVSLFSARIGQHLILTLLAAPMIAAGRPGAAFLALVGRKSVGAGAPLLASGLFAALLWFWHAPGPYAATFDGPWAYWAMHVSLTGTAIWLWSGLLEHGTRPGRALAAGLLSTVQMSLLGCLITLAPQPLYTPHLATAGLWNLTPLQDQELGGALMWVPGGLAFLAAAMAELKAALSTRRALTA